MNAVRWINPVAPEPQTDAEATAAIDKQILAGTRLRFGTLDNTKDNAALLLELIAERVKEELSAATVQRRKAFSSLGASTEILDELAREADFVLTAMAD